jgi:hypothetical protein
VFLAVGLHQVADILAQEGSGATRSTWRWG